MLKVVDEETTEDFMLRLKIRPAESELKCSNCDSQVVFNEHGFMAGMAFVRYVHDCPKEYWVSRLVPVSKKEKEFWAGIAKGM